MRVGFNMLSERWPTCGMRRYLITLLKKLEANGRGHEYVRLYPHSRVYRSGLSAKKTLGKVTWELWGIQRKASKLRLDVLHCPYWACPLRPTLPTVVTIPDVVPLMDIDGFDVYRRRLASRLYYWLVARAARRASAVIALSEAGARDVTQRIGLDPRRVFVTPLAVPKEYCRLTEHDVSEAVMRYHLHRPYVLVVGAGFDYRKDLTTAMKAFRLARGMYGRELQLVVVGDWALAGGTAPVNPHMIADDLELRSGVEVNLVGFVDEDDLPAVYSGAEVLVCTSRYEGFGLSVLEAMACGVPVLVSDILPLRELCGAAGTYAMPGDERMFASKLAQLLQDESLSRERANLGLERAQLYSWDRVAEQTIRVYEQVIKGG